MTVVVLLLVAGGCAGLDKPAIALKPVGPPPLGREAARPIGALQVYSRTEESTPTEGEHYYLHTAYVIQTADGKTYKRVENRRWPDGEEPTLVPLPVGNYRVIAESDGWLRVSVPVVIKPGQTTTLVLDKDWRPPVRFNEAEMVRLPNGRFVGWLAEESSNANRNP